MQDEGKGTPDAAEGTSAKKPKGPAGGLKVSEKGALSVYGLGRFPVTLYKEQWKRLLEQSDEIKAFIAAHDSELKTKGDDPKAGEKAEA